MHVKHEKTRQKKVSDKGITPIRSLSKYIAFLFYYAIDKSIHDKLNRERNTFCNDLHVQL